MAKRKTTSRDNPKSMTTKVPEKNSTKIQHTYHESLVPLLDLPLGEVRVVQQEIKILLGQFLVL